MPDGEEQRRAPGRVHLGTPVSPGHISRPSTANGSPHEPEHYPVGESAWPLPATARLVSPPRPPRATISIGEFFAVIRRRILAFLLCFLLCVVAAFGLYRVAAKKYDAQSAVKVAPVTASGDTGAAKDISTITESRIVTSTAVAAEARKLLGYPGSPNSLLGHVKVSSPLNSQLIYITYTAGTPKAAANGANAFAQAYLTYRKSVGQANLADKAQLLKGEIAALQAQLRKLPANATSSQRSALQRQIDGLNDQLSAITTTVVVPGQMVGVAQRPSAPSSPKKILYVGAGILLGLIVGAVVAVVRDRRDDGVHGAEDLEQILDAPVLATVATTRPSAGPPVALAAAASGRAEELDAYRRTATKLRTPVLGRGASAFLVARGGRGAEELAPMNLAAMFARQNLQTALVTSDAGLKAIETLFGDWKPPRTLEDGLTPVPALPDLWVLALGYEDEIANVISSQRAHIEDLLDLVDIAIIDGVNVALASSPLALAQLSGATVVVASDSRTTHAELHRLVSELHQVGAEPLGSMLFRRRRFRLRRRRAAAAPVPAGEHRSHRSEDATSAKD